MNLLTDFLKNTDERPDFFFPKYDDAVLNISYVNTSLRDILQEYLRSGPSRLKWTWGLSLMMNTMSAGILLGAWSPSRWNVILVPDFQPGFTLIVSTWSIMKIIRDQRVLFYHTFSSFLAVPSPATTLREIFIRLVTPWKCKIVNKNGTVNIKGFHFINFSSSSSSILF